MIFLTRLFHLAGLGWIQLEWIGSFAMTYEQSFITIKPLRLFISVVTIYDLPKESWRKGKTWLNVAGFDKSKFWSRKMLGTSSLWGDSLKNILNACKWIMIETYSNYFLLTNQPSLEENHFQTINQSSKFWKRLSINQSNKF